jgi:sugar phosphate isomerase/epimerase
MTTPSVQLYTVREAMATDTAGTIARLADLGVKHVEPYGFDRQVKEYRAAMASAGVTAPSGHAPVIDSDRPEAAFDAAAELGITIVIDPYIPSPRWQTIDQVAALADRVNALSDIATERGLLFDYHNHNWELATRIEGRPVLDLFVDRLAPSVVLEIDTYWSSVGGADTPELLRLCGDRVRLLHMKDGTLDGDITKQQPLGGGEIDVAGILAAAPQAMRVIEFDAYAGDLFVGISASLHWLSENDK